VIRAGGAGTKRLRRTLAAAGSLFAAWVAVDSLPPGMTGTYAAGTWAFYLFWGVPFGAASLFLGWYAWRGARPAAARSARSGCVGAVALGGTVFLVLGARFLGPSRDLLGAVIDGLTYAPLAGVAGLGLGLGLSRAHARRRAR